MQPLKCLVSPRKDHYALQAQVSIQETS